ncbi:MAG: hypothetical protein WA705_13550 [Candidatus Ozemobacteraceae bacterium]
MNIRKVRGVFRGAIFFMFLLLMSISLTGCAFLAALGPILSLLGSIGSIAGTVVGIFNPSAGQAISQASSGLTNAGSQASTYAAQNPSATPTTQSAPAQSGIPTAISASTNSEDSKIGGVSKAPVAVSKAQGTISTSQSNGVDLSKNDPGQMNLTPTKTNTSQSGGVDLSKNVPIQMNPSGMTQSSPEPEVITTPPAR